MRQRNPFRNLAFARVRLIRVRDGKIFSGTLKEMSSTQLKLSMKSVGSCVSGDEFTVEVHGPVTRLVFSAILENSEGAEAVMVVGPEIQFLSTSEPVRLAVEGLSVLATWGDDQMVGAILDISREGVCMMLREEIMCGSMVSLEIKDKRDSYKLQGCVRYCIEQNEGNGRYRLGIQLVHEERADSTKWMSLFARTVGAA